MVSDGKTIIYRYDATIGRRITGNDVLSLLRATPKHAGLRNHIEGQEKILAESGSARGFKPVGYSKGIVYIRMENIHLHMMVNLFKY